MEYGFGVVKHLWGYRKVRHKGLDKNQSQLFALFTLSNLYRARKSLLHISKGRAVDPTENRDTKAPLLVDYENKLFFQFKLIVLQYNTRDSFTEQ